MPTKVLRVKEADHEEFLTWQRKINDMLAEDDALSQPQVFALVVKTFKGHVREWLGLVDADNTQDAG